MSALSSQGRPRPRRPSHKPKKTATLVAQRLVSEIADGNFPPGTPLLSERAMLDEYGVARGSLREALRFLEMQGIISIKTGPGGGPVVNGASSRHLASILAMLLQLEHAPFGDVLEARVVLEPALASRAAERITAEELEALHQSVRRMKANIDDVNAFLAENEVFHSIIARAAGNHVFGLVINSLNWISDATALGVDYPEDVRRSVAKEHGRIYQAIKAGDGSRASVAMSVHISDFAAYVERFYPAVMSAPLRWDQLD